MKSIRYLASAVSLSTLALLTAAHAVGAPASTASFVGPGESRLWAGFGYLSEENAHFLRFTGPVEEGSTPLLELDLRYRGEDEEDGRYGQLELERVGLDSPHLFGRYGVQGDYGLFLDYRERPRFHGSGLLSPLRAAGKERLVLPEAGGAATAETWSEEWEVEQKRRRVAVGGQRVLTEKWRLNASFNREEKEGRRLGGYGDWTEQFSFQLPARIDHRTDQFEVGAEYAGEQLQGRVGYHLSQFKQLGYLGFDVDDPTAADWANGTTQRLVHKPDNTYHRLSGSLGYTLQAQTRVSAEFDVGRTRQTADFVDDPAYAAEQAVLPSDLDARVNVTRLGLRGSHRLGPRLQFRGNYRYEDWDNKTDVYDVGNLRTRVHSWSRHTANLDADVRLPGRNSLLVGYQAEETQRNLADDKTHEHKLHSRLRMRFNDRLTASLFGRYADRYGANYLGPGRSDPAVRSNIPTVRAYHLADLQGWELGAVASYSVAPQLALGVELTSGNDDYTDSQAGLLHSDQTATTLTLDFFSGEHLSGYSFVTHEEKSRLQAGDVRRLNHYEATWTFGFGVRAVVTQDERLTLGAEVVSVDSTTELELDDGGAGSAYPDLTLQMTQLQLYGTYQASEQVALRLAYFGQRYREKDWALGYGPGSAELMGMGQEAYDYTAHWVVASLGYQF